MKLYSAVSVGAVTIETAKQLKRKANRRKGFVMNIIRIVFLCKIQHRIILFMLFETPSMLNVNE